MSDLATGTMITVNGASEEVAATDLAGLLDEKGIEGGRGVAVALNGRVVPRTAWATTALRAGDAVELVQARQGG